MDAVKTGSIVSLIVSMVLLGACSPSSPARPREATPEAVASRPVLPVDVPTLPPPTLAPPTLAPPPALAPPVATPPSVPSAPVAAASAVIGATGGTRVNVRTDPSLRAPVVMTLAKGTPVEMLDEPVQADGRSWQKIRSGDREGWVVAVVVQPR